MHSIFAFIDDLHLWLIQNLPGAFGFRLRHSYWKTRLRSLGKNTRIDCGVYFQGAKYISIGDNCWIDRCVTILAGQDTSTRKKRSLKVKSFAERGEVKIGNNVHIGPFSIISGIESGVFIGNDCTFSSGVKVYAFSHHYRFDDDRADRSCSFGSMVSQERQSMLSGAITLERNVGVALNAVILPGVWIGQDSFVGIAALVMPGEYDENSVLYGSPAKRHGPRFC